MFARSKSDLPALLCLALCAIVFVTLDDYGLTWDEPVYSVSGHDHFVWLTHPSWRRLEGAWKSGSEHPPLGTLVGGLCIEVLNQRHSLMEWHQAFRLQTLLYVFILNFALFTWVSECWGRATAFVAVLSFFFLPRAFFHAHVGALDYPMAAMWVAAAYAFWKGLAIPPDGGRASPPDGGRASPRWMLAASVLLGLALLTKVNGFFLWTILLAWFVVWFRADLWRLLRDRFRGCLSERAPVVRSLAALVLIPPAVFFIGWPWLWRHPFSRTWDYLTWASAHEQHPVYYMGKTWICPPWHYAFVLTAVTIPLVVLIPMLVGIFRLPRTTNRSAATFLLLNALVPIAVIAFLSSCAYDGERLWLPAFPFLCALSAVGVRELYRLAERVKAQAAFVAVYGALFAASICFSVVRYHPYEASYFNEIVGGVDGAAARGFETEYWEAPYLEVLPWLNAHSESTFWIPIDSRMISIYQIAGRLTPALQGAVRANADYLVLLIRQGMINPDPELWEIYTHQKPVYAVKVRNTPLVGVYDMKAVREAR